jgi:uncharacterized OB-fold protein
VTSHPHPRPVLDDDNAPFWLGCREHRLMLQRCESCDAWQFPPRSRCRSCRSSDVSWQQASGRGTVASYTICHPPVLPAYADRVPYNVIVVRLDEGPHLVSNLLDAEPSVDLPVQVKFVQVDDELTLPQFRAVQLVPEVGLEPTRPFGATLFKSALSTDSSTRAMRGLAYGAASRFDRDTSPSGHGSLDTAAEGFPGGCRRDRR